MGEMLPPFVIAMVPVLNGKVVSDLHQPLYMIKPENVEAFKARWDGVPDGLEYVALPSVMDLRGPFPRALP